MKAVKILAILFGTLIVAIAVSNFLPLRNPFTGLGTLQKPYPLSTWTKDVLESTIGSNLYSGIIGGIVSSALEDTQDDYGLAKVKTWGAAKFTYRYPGEKDTTIIVKDVEICRSVKMTNVLSWDTFYDISFQLPNTRHIMISKLLSISDSFAGNTSYPFDKDDRYMFASVRVIEPASGFRDIMLKDNLYPDFVIEIYPENRIQYWKMDGGKFILSFKHL
jgi:hypothetical protein